MRTISALLSQRLLAALAVALWLAQAVGAVDTPLDAGHVHFLIVVDTDAGGGSTWALDGRNFKGVVHTGLNRQKLTGRYSFETFSGDNVTAARVLAYYRDLDVKPDDVLVFYYSGHGATHLTRGHFMQFAHGPLLRNDLLAAMQNRQPRLVVLLTDCCADYAGGRLAGSRPAPMADNDLGGAADIPDPPTRKSVKGLGVLEPVQLPVMPRNRRRPPPAATGPANNDPGGTGVVFRTGDGPLPIKAILDTTDGVVLRHLFYRHTGLVDINGCRKGKSSHGEISWGGSLFTIGLLSLQKEPAPRFDTNGNGLVEWSEFFPHLQTSCQRAGKAVGAQQVPEAVQLGQPVLVKK